MKFLILFLASIFVNASAESLRFDLPANDFNSDDSQCGDASISLPCDDTGRGQYYGGKYDGVSVTYIFTEPESYQRVKLTTRKKGFGIGVYRWRVFIPDFPSHDAISIGMFLYSYTHNDEINQDHELDFECGYGRLIDRLKVSALQENEAICHLTSQGLPDAHKIIKIKTDRWYEFSIEINRDGQANWLVDGVKRYGVNLEYGNEVKFKPYISVEHLSFMGKNYPPTSGLSVPFDYVWYSSATAPPGPPTNLFFE